MAKGMNIAERVEALVSPVITEMGYRVWDVEYVKEGAEWYLRITLDSDNGIDINDCEKVSRAVSPMLDEEDPIEDFYYLEVHSPGLERVLRKEAHFLASIGSEIEIRLFTADENKKKAYTGKLTAFENDTVIFDDNGETRSIPMNKISKVQTLFDFKSINMKEG